MLLFIFLMRNNSEWWACLPITLLSPSLFDIHYHKERNVVMLSMPVVVEISPRPGFLYQLAQTQSKSEFHRPNKWILIWTGGSCILLDGLGWNFNSDQPKIGSYTYLSWVWGSRGSDSRGSRGSPRIFRFWLVLLGAATASPNSLAINSLTLLL